MTLVVLNLHFSDIAYHQAVSVLQRRISWPVPLRQTVVRALRFSQRDLCARPQVGGTNPIFN
jgi:hypothetical protein